MSKPKYWWHGYIKRALKEYPKFKDRQEPEYKALAEAIEKAADDIRMTKDGAVKIQAIEKIIREGKSEQKVANELFYARRTITRWLSEYIMLIGKRKGYIEK